MKLHIFYFLSESGENIIVPEFLDISVAVATPTGLMTPVIRSSENFCIGGYDRNLAKLAEKGRAGDIQMKDMAGGNFTVSNGGVFGSMMGTPIINPPQSAILGLHATQTRPKVMPNGNIEARPMMYIALTYDHRIIDGREAVLFLKEIKECIEDPEGRLGMLECI